MIEKDESHNQLLQQAKEGDDAALERLIEYFRPVLRGRAAQSLGHVQHRVDPSDVVQITWWSAFRAFPGFEGDIDAFAGWLCKINDRNVQDAIRDQNAEKRAIAREVSGSVGFPEELLRLTTPSQRLAKLELEEQLKRQIELLPMAQGEAIRLRYFRGLSIAQIVEHIGRSEAAVAGLLKRGLSQLRQVMSESEIR